MQSEFNTEQFKEFLVRFEKAKNKRVSGDAIANALSNAAELVLTTAKTVYLHGRALHVRSGRLWSSVTKQPGTGAMRDKKNEYVVTVGTNVIYGRVWEYGYQGTVNVQTHVRVIKKALGKKRPKPLEVTVRAHSREVNMEARPWLDPSFRDNMSNTERLLARAGLLDFHIVAP